MKKERLGNVELELEEINKLNMEKNTEDSKQTFGGPLTSAICC